eukprot:CAMPEP_0179166600 /NCGR_PEP_ID=MMETSP0796-20121207/81860_1 /TAXON_ID=73915 /ORGANISM="Pyrodinium bahamense, Strain pbaha01" /LENGTH=674 /DNA_ID=CAMNT_0020869209 /DNA_START=11 /DNA_END=2035 /DNA_ORIENTATION=+
MSAPPGQRPDFSSGTHHPSFAGFPGHQGSPSSQGGQEYQRLPSSDTMGYGGHVGPAWQTMPPLYPSQQAPRTLLPAQQCAGSDPMGYGGRADPAWQTVPPLLPSQQTLGSLPPSQQSAGPYLPMQQSMVSMLSMGSGSFSTRYYDTKYEAMPPTSSSLPTKEKDALEQGASFRSTASGHSTASGATKASSQQSLKSVSSDVAQAKLPRIPILWAVEILLCALALMAIALGAAWSSHRVSTSDSFRTFCVLSSEGGFSLFVLAMQSLVVLALLALLLALLTGLSLLQKQPRTHLRLVLASSTAFLGCTVLLLVLVVWLSGKWARPEVVRTANLLCQDLRAWSCESSSTVAHQLGHFLEAEWAPMAREAPAGFWHDGGDSMEGAAGTTPEGRELRRGRRLNPAHSADSYAHSLNSTANTGGGSELCTSLQRLCARPPGFDQDTACVCSGRWREPRGSDAVNGSGTWASTVGAYCEAWHSGQAPWCFVSNLQNCSRKTQSIEDVDGSNFTRSEGPCTDQVDSRSQFVLHGYRALNRSLVVAAVLGLASLVLSACGVALRHRQPPKSAPESTDNGTKADVRLEPPQEAARRLKERFQDAQQEAMAKLSDTTPQDVRLLLYGFYHQAKKGNVLGTRPGFFNTKDRSKFDAWAKLKDMSAEEAMEGYIAAVSLIDEGARS